MFDDAKFSLRRSKEAFAENVQAIRSYEKAGFLREGLLCDDVCIDGEYRDIVWMAALNPETK